MIIKSAGLFALVGLVAGWSLLGISGQPNGQPNQPQEEQKQRQDATDFMLIKLDAAREIVAGLARGDFGKIAKSAQDLMLMSHEADWQVETTPAYLKMSSEFRGSAERLRDNAEEENLDGSTLAYFEVTLNCVRCHKYIRDKK